MKYPEKEIRLKDGRTAILRSPTPEDAEKMLTVMRQTAAETPFLLRTPEECTETAEQEVAFIQGVVESESQAMILCLINGRLAGNCQIVRGIRKKGAHRGRVAIALLKEYWGLGIGTALFREMIAIAEAWGLMQLELEFIEGNDRAQALYEKMGFAITGYLPNAIRLADGTLLKEYQMVRPM